MIAFLNDFDTMQNEKIALKIIDKAPQNGEALPYYYYDIYNSQGEHTGKISIRIGYNAHAYYNGHIGYEVFEPYRGNRYAFEAAKLVLRVAKAHGMAEIVITCGQSNTASARTIERLGAALIEIARVPKDYLYYYDGIENHRIYRLRL